MRIRITVILTISILLVACHAVGPKYKRPVVAAPTEFRGAEFSSTLDSGSDTSSLADLRWFEVFRDETLQDLIRIALVENYDLRDAVARVDAARASLGITRSGQFPDVAAGVGTTTVRTSTSGAVPLFPGVNQNRTFGGIALNVLSYEPDVWGRLRLETEASRAGLLASEENRKAVVTTLVGDVAAAYFGLIGLDRELEIAQNTLNTRRNSLKLIQTRESRGLATVLEVRQGEQLVYTAERAIPTIEESIERTENQISLLVGHSPSAIMRGTRLEDQVSRLPCLLACLRRCWNADRTFNWQKINSLVQTPKLVSPKRHTSRESA